MGTLIIQQIFPLYIIRPASLVKNKGDYIMAKQLSGFPNYSQTDGSWEYLCTTDGDFEEYGCGICCCANITQYKEGGTKSPATMRSRGVFTASNLATQWSNASTQFSWGGEEYASNMSGAIKEIKKQIDNYSDPVVLRIGNSSTKHFVTVWGYKNSCTSASDVLIRDSYNNDTTLQAALGTWPTFYYLKRII